MKLKNIIKESFFGGVWGVAPMSKINGGIKEFQGAPSLPAKPGIPQKPNPSTAPAPKAPAPKPKPAVQKSPTQVPVKPEVNPEVDAATPDTADFSLNYKVGPGYKVKFEGKPGEFYIVRVMDKAMKNFLVANKVLGIKQFYNVRVESILSDEHNKAIESNNEEPVKETVSVEPLMESFTTFIRRIR